eukprot:Colp12_sorted_trinity150504_noHs@33548
MSALSAKVRRANFKGSSPPSIVGVLEDESCLPQIGEHIREVSFKEEGEPSKARIKRSDSHPAPRKSQYMLEKARAFLQAQQKHMYDPKERMQMIKDLVLNEIPPVARTKTFRDCFASPEFDSLVLATILYFTSYFRLKEVEARLSSDDHTSTTNRVHLEAECTKIRVRVRMREREMGERYALLVLTYSVPAQSLKDRLFFETIYNADLHIAWIVFGYTNWPTLSEELGRLFRTESFNLNARTSAKPQRPAKTAEEEAHSRPTTSEKRVRIRTPPPPSPTPKRPPRTPERNVKSLYSALYVRSPLIASLLPTPKERAGWLFGNHGVLNLQRNKTPVGKKGGPGPSESSYKLQHCESLDDLATILSRPPTSGQTGFEEQGLAFNMQRSRMDTSLRTALATGEA